MTLLSGLYSKQFWGTISVFDGASKTNKSSFILRPFISFSLGSLLDIITRICKVEGWENLKQKIYNKTESRLCCWIVSDKFFKSKPTCGVSILLF